MDKLAAYDSDSSNNESPEEDPSTMRRPAGPERPPEEEVYLDPEEEDPRRVIRETTQPSKLPKMPSIDPEKEQLSSQETQEKIESLLNLKRPSEKYPEGLHFNQTILNGTKLSNPVFSSRQMDFMGVTDQYASTTSNWQQNLPSDGYIDQLQKERKKRTSVSFTRASKK